MQDLLSVVVPIAGAHVVVLAAIIVIIRRLLLSDTMKAVEKVRQAEAEVRKKEEAIRLEIQEHENEFSARKAAAEAELQEQREETQKEAGRLKEQILGDARKEADRIHDQAKKGEQRMREQIQQEMDQKAVEYGVEVFKMVFSERITDAIDEQFINELLDALREVDASSISVDASDTMFRTSRALNPGQKTAIKSLLSEKFGTEVDVAEQVDDSLVAGLVMKIGSLEIDGSLLNRCREAADRIKRSG